jgi:hypothetical protein
MIVLIFAVIMHPCTNNNHKKFVRRFANANLGSFRVSWVVFANLLTDNLRS